MQRRPETKRWIYLPRWGLLLVILLMIALAANWAGGRLISATEMSSGATLLLLILYALLIAVPFVPGIEVGLALLMLEGAEVAFEVYVATILGLSLSYATGRFVPVRHLVALANWLGLTGISTALKDPDRSTGDSLRRALSRLPASLRSFLSGFRYLVLAAALNLPGNSLIGGGGGICLICGASRAMRPGYFLLTLVFAVAPVPLLFSLSGAEGL